MREIKFRGMGLNNGEWVYGVGVTKYLFSIETYGEGRAWIFVSPHGNKSDVNGGWIEVYPETVGEYIGRLDKNDKEIYEGDIIEVSMSCDGGTLPHIGKIVYDSTFGSFGTENEAGITLLHNHCLHTAKVIGNIHENPELLGGVK